MSSSHDVIILHVYSNIFLMKWTLKSQILVKMIIRYISLIKCMSNIWNIWKHIKRLIPTVLNYGIVKVIPPTFCIILVWHVGEWLPKSYLTSREYCNWCKNTTVMKPFLCWKYHYDYFVCFWYRSNSQSNTNMSERELNILSKRVVLITYVCVSSVDVFVKNELKLLTLYDVNICLAMQILQNCVHYTQIHLNHNWIWIMQFN